MRLPPLRRRPPAAELQSTHTSRILPAAEQPGKRAAPQLPRVSGQCPAPPSTDPPPEAEDRRQTPAARSRKSTGLSRKPLTTSASASSLRSLAGRIINIDDMDDGITNGTVVCNILLPVFFRKVDYLFFPFHDSFFCRPF